MKTKLNLLWTSLLVLLITISLGQFNTFATEVEDSHPLEMESSNLSEKQNMDTDFLKEYVKQGYSLESLLSERKSFSRAALGSETAKTYLASYFPQTNPINTYYGRQLNNPERYIYYELVKFYSEATAQRGVNGQVEYELESGYPFTNLSEARFEALYKTCSDELLLYWQVAIQAFMQDYPQYDVMKLIFYGPCFLVYYDEDTKSYTGHITIKIKYDYSGETEEIYDQQKALQKVCKGITLKGTRFEKVRAIHDYICNRVTYPSEYSFENTSIYSAYGALVEKKAVCQGYALAFKLLCDKHGIPCQAIAGLSSRDGINFQSHMWNAVQMEDGKWYAVDVTWDDTDTIHYDFCLVGSKSKPKHYAQIPFQKSHKADMNYSRGNYSGSLTAPTLNSTLFRGIPFQKSEKKLSITLKPKSFKYNGTARTPAVTVKYGTSILEEGVDYSVTYQDNIDAGVAKVLLDGMGSFQGNIVQKFTIKKALSKCQITLSSKSFTYSGKAKKPSVTIQDGTKTLQLGEDYTIKYQKNVNAGTAKVIITGKGGYTGTITKKFTIKKAEQVLSFTNEYKKVYGCKDFYLNIKNSGNGKLKYKSSNPRIAKVWHNGKVTIAGTGYATITVKAEATKNYKEKSVTINVSVSPKQQIIKKLKAEQAGKFLVLTIDWKVDLQATGYEIKYSKSKNFKKDVKTINVNKYKVTSKTISKLEKGTYYVKARSYKQAVIEKKKKKLYGAWSTVKSIK